MVTVFTICCSFEIAYFKNPFSNPKAVILTLNLQEAACDSVKSKPPVLSYILRIFPAANDMSSNHKEGNSEEGFSVKKNLHLRCKDEYCYNFPCNLIFRNAIKRLLGI